MKILAIETSCDDTGVAVLEAKNGSFEMLSNIVSSQTEVHKQYGGVFPAMAKREHQKNLVPSFELALKQAGLLSSKSKNLNPKQIPNSKLKTLNKILKREPELEKDLVLFLQKYEKPDIDFISVTNGPGLEPCLWVGVNFVRAISYFWNIPVVATNHIESHILVNVLENKDIRFPAIALVVSGGHTQLILAKKIGSYKILGETRDDAAGECFDKCAKLLGLGYPGGAIISKLAENIRPENFLPRPMIATKDYDFSFSGLKTAVLYADKKVQNKTKKYKKQMAAEVQQAIIDVLLKKTMKAVKDFKAKSLILGGGVSANQELRKQFNAKLGHESKVSFFAPSPNLSTDNAVMAAITGYFHAPSLRSKGASARQSKKTAWQKLSAQANLRIGK